MAKNIETSTPANTAASVLDPQAIIQEVAAELEIAKGQCTNEQYALLIFIGLEKAGILQRDKLPAALDFWSKVPKNQSAMRQFLEKETKAPAQSKLLAKYLGGTQQG